MISLKPNIEETKQHYIDWWNGKGVVLNMWEHLLLPQAEKQGFKSSRVQGSKNQAKYGSMLSGEQNIWIGMSGMSV